MLGFNNKKTMENNDLDAIDVNVNRRSFLLGASCVIASSLISLPAFASLSMPTRKIGLYNIHTGERDLITYWEEGRYIKEGLANLNKILRDHRTGEIHNIDPKLFDQITLLQHNLRRKGDIEIISGYRSPKTNNMLRGRSGGVAKKSYHMKGQAIDLRLPGAKLSDLRRAAINMKSGGVGYYPKSNFIHIDTGPVRSWT